MNKNYCLSSEELLKAEAALMAAKQFGFIEEAGFPAMEQRCALANEEKRQKLLAGEVVYGVTTYSYAAYLQQELTRFKLDFLCGKAKNYVYRRITEKEKEDFYCKNRDLFTDFYSESYDYEDVKEVIEKRIREEAYDGYLADILCQFCEGM